MTSGTNINIPAALGIANSMRDTLLPQIQSSLANLDSEAQQANSYWKGNTYNKFQPQYQQFNTDSGKMHQSLTSLTSALGDAIKALQSLDHG